MKCLDIAQTIENELSGTQEQIEELLALCREKLNNWVLPTGKNSNPTLAKITSSLFEFGRNMMEIEHNGELRLESQLLIPIQPLDAHFQRREKLTLIGQRPFQTEAEFMSYHPYPRQRGIILLNLTDRCLNQTVLVRECRDIKLTEITLATN